MLNAALATRPAAPLLPLLLTVPAAGAAAWSPSEMIDSWVSDETNVSLPIASLSGLTPAAASGIAGDARQVALSLAKQMFVWYNDLASKPQALSVQYSSRGVRTSGTWVGKEMVEIRLTAYVEFPEGTIAAEPT